MKLRNKSTGETGCLVCSFEKIPEKITVVQCIDGKRGSKVWYYKSLAELNEEWEDYEEPKEYWYLDNCGNVLSDQDNNSAVDKIRKAIGNYFETEEEAGFAVEELKAWKRLKDKGLEFDGWGCKTPDGTFLIMAKAESCDEVVDDLDLLFGGGE